jgi:hypothetical protein
MGAASHGLAIRLSRQLFTESEWRNPQTSHACDLAFANKDLIGRVRHLQMTTWTSRDLEQIAQKRVKIAQKRVSPHF